VLLGSGLGAVVIRKAGGLIDNREFLGELGVESGVAPANKPDKLFMVNLSLGLALVILCTDRHTQ